MTRPLSFAQLLDERPKSPFAESNLPENPPPNPTVSMRREAMVKFRNDYTYLLQFVAIVTNVPWTKVGPADCLRWLAEHEAALIARATPEEGAQPMTDQAPEEP